MSKLPVRALIGLALALALAAVAAPPSGADRSTEAEVSTAAVAPPVIFGLLDEVTVPAAPGEVLGSAAERVSEDVADATAPPAAPPAPDPQPAVSPAPPPPPPAPAPAGTIQSIVERHFGAAAGQAMRIAECESSLNPAAVSVTDDHGLFQINAPSHRGQFERVTGRPWSAVYDAEANTIYAKWLYDQQGWSPWACRRVL